MQTYYLWKRIFLVGESNSESDEEMLWPSRRPCLGPSFSNTRTCHENQLTTFAVLTEQKIADGFADNARASVYFLRLGVSSLRLLPFPPLMSCRSFVYIF